MSLQETIYNFSPVVLQNIMVSIYGMKLYYERYMGNYSKSLKELLESQWFSQNKINAIQNKKLSHLISHAYRNIPYYNTVFKQKGLSPNDFNSVDDLKKLPVLKKEIVRKYCDSLIAKNMGSKKLIKLNTSGTTGKTLSISVDIESRRREYAFITRSQIWAGLNNGKHNVTFGGRVLIPERKITKKFWRYNAVMDNYLFSSYHLSDKNLPYIIKKIRKIRPKFINSYPSSIYVVAKFIEENGLKGIYPKSIITSAETLLDFQRDTIEKVFNCRVFDQYGCTEQGVFVSQCEMGTYHIHPEYGYVEILDENGNDVETGEMGKVVCTGFTNMAMPLIRYDIGDIAIKGSGLCKCGRNFPIIKQIIGRQDDFIKTTDGKKVGRLDPVFKGLTTIKNAQIIQKSLNDIEVMVIPGEGYLHKDGEIIITELKKRLGRSMNISIKLVKKISKTPTGKFKSVISKI